MRVESRHHIIDPELIVTNQSVGGIQDGLAATVVLSQGDDSGGRVNLEKGELVFD